MTNQFTTLAEIPEKWGQPPASMITKLNRGKGVVLDYVGHADVTLILCQVDPMWTYDWNRDEYGNMAIRKSGSNLVLEGTLTVHGVTRPCVGTCQSNKGEPEKELTGDLIRNGAMRFGIATKLWSKLDDATDDHRAPARAADEPDKPMTQDEIDKFVKACKDAGLVPEDVIADALPMRSDDERLMKSQKRALIDSFTKMRDGLAALQEMTDDAPEAELPLGDPPPADEIRPASKSMVGKIKGMYDDLGVTDRLEQLRQTAEFLSLDGKLASHNNLNIDQASALIDHLTSRAES